MALLKTMTSLERARFLVRYAHAHARKYVYVDDERGYKVRVRRTKPKEKFMSARMTEFVTELPTKDFNTLLSVTRSLPASRADVALAALNVQSFAANALLGQPTPPLMEAKDEPVSNDDADAAICECLAVADGTMKAAPGALLVILKWIAPLVLKFILK